MFTTEYYTTLVGTDTRPTQRCKFEQP